MKGEGEATKKIRKPVKIAEVRTLRQTAGSGTITVCKYKKNIYTKHPENYVSTSL